MHTTLYIKRGGLEKFGFVPSFWLDGVPHLAQGETWNVPLPVAAPVRLEDGVLEAKERNYFTVTLVFVNRAPHWVVVAGAKELAAHVHCATFPRGRDHG